MPCYESELKIKDLKDIILDMGVIQIILNGTDVWNDDFDITGLNEIEAQNLIKENIGKLEKVLNGSDLVRSIKFDIVDYHHSICNIST